MELAGNGASQYEKKSDSKMPSLSLILIMVAGAMGLFLMLLACCCVSYLLPGYTCNRMSAVKFVCALLI